MTFNLKYDITDADMREVNKKAMTAYIIVYFAVAAVGIAVGVIATVLSNNTMTYVLGIILTVMGGLLLCVAVLLVFAPKNNIRSAVPTGDNNIEVTVDKNGITADGNNIASFADIKNVKVCKCGAIIVWLSDNAVFLIKNGFVGDGSMKELFDYMSERKGKILLDADAH